MSINTDPSARAKWRPISEFYEELQPVVVIDIEDPGGVAVAWNDDIDPDSGAWTHFAELPLLTSAMGDELREAYQIAKGAA